MSCNSCNCPACRARRDAEIPIERLGHEPAHRELGEEQESDLAMELLGVSSEEELEQFLGNLFKRVGRGLKGIGKLARPLGSALKGLAKTALPFVGGALGSFIPVPGVGTAIGTALGSAIGSALEMEFHELEQDEAEFEMARRFVRIATSAARQAFANPQGDPHSVVRNALASAARAHLPRLDEQATQSEANEDETEWHEEEFDEAEQHAYGVRGLRPSGRWVRRGRRIVLLDL